MCFTQKIKNKKINQLKNKTKSNKIYPINNNNNNNNNNNHSKPRCL